MIVFEFNWGIKSHLACCFCRGYKQYVLEIAYPSSVWNTCQTLTFYMVYYFAWVSWRIDLALWNHLSGIHRVGTTNKAWRRNGVERDCTLDQVWRRCRRVQSMGKTTRSFTYISQSPGIAQRIGKRWIILFFFGARSQLQKSWKLLKEGRHNCHSMPSFTQMAWDLVLVFVFFHLVTLGIKKVVFVYIVNCMSSCPQYLQTDRSDRRRWMGRWKVLSDLAFQEIDFLLSFSLSLSPNSFIVRARRQRKLRINLG